MAELIKHLLRNCGNTKGSAAKSPGYTLYESPAWQLKGPPLANARVPHSIETNKKKSTEIYLLKTDKTQKTV